MSIRVTRASLEDVVPWRERHRAEMRCQIVHDSFARRGFSDIYLVEQNGSVVGYALVAHTHCPGAIDEFYLEPGSRGSASDVFEEIVRISGATSIRAQTNDRLLSLMLWDHASGVTSEVLLFDDGFTTTMASPGGELRKRDDVEGEQWAIARDGEIVATGGLLFHYNPPYGDIFMDVVEEHRRQGFGSYLVQELKRIAYELGRIPAARCSVANLASRRTLQKAGMVPCARILTGAIGRAAALRTPALQEDRADGRDDRTTAARAPAP